MRISHDLSCSKESNHSDSPFEAWKKKQGRVEVAPWSVQCDKVGYGMVQVSQMASGWFPLTCDEFRLDAGKMITKQKVLNWALFCAYWKFQVYIIIIYLYSYQIALKRGRMHNNQIETSCSFQQKVLPHLLQGFRKLPLLWVSTQNLAPMGLMASDVFEFLAYNINIVTHYDLHIVTIDIPNRNIGQKTEHSLLNHRIIFYLHFTDYRYFEYIYIYIINKLHAKFSAKSSVTGYTASWWYHNNIILEGYKRVQWNIYDIYDMIRCDVNMAIV